MCVLASVLLQRTVVIPFLTRKTAGVASLRKRMLAGRRRRYNFRMDTSSGIPST